MSRIVTIEVEGPYFYSYGDEESFFGRLQKLPCVLSIQGELKVLFIDVEMDGVDGEDIREIISTFHRYGLPLGELRKLENAEVSTWLRNTNAYWYAGMFEGGDFP